MFALAIGGGVVSQAADPSILDVSQTGTSLEISVFIPEGMGHVVLQSRTAVELSQKTAVIAGSLDGRAAVVTFMVPDPGAIVFFNVMSGTDPEAPSATYQGAEYFEADYESNYLALSADEKVGHVLNRLAYGPTAEDKILVEQMGVAAYIDQQINPDSVAESLTLGQKESEIFVVYYPGEDSPLIEVGDLWRYTKGDRPVDAGWKSAGFDDSAWLTGPTGIGYGDEDDETVLEDMAENYVTFYARKLFAITALSEIDQLIFSIDFDDSFIAYLNGTEIARDNISIANPDHEDMADGNREAGIDMEFNLADFKGLLVEGENLLAIEVHNVTIDSSDASMIPALSSRKLLPVPPSVRLGNVADLQQLIHLRGVYSKRQLQAVMAEFWENHFTTDFDKVAGYFDDLRDSNASDSMSESQSYVEAANAEYREYQFFHDNAFGRFGDLLLYSATSPTQLIYLDNVANMKSGPNENYAREIFELFAFGVDNRYTQQDIEELARCFTGWTVTKVGPGQEVAFPASATNPPTLPSVRYEDASIVEIGAGWKYMKGTLEPAPSPTGQPTIAWTTTEFNDNAWLSGATSIGYDDDDDATELADMRGNYLSVYLRRHFSVEDLEGIDNLILSIDYDDGFVAYLNGVEIARSEGLGDRGNIPAFDEASRQYHESEGVFEDYSLSEFTSLLLPAPAENILAIQVHNGSLGSSDLSIHPRLLRRSLLPGSIENGDPNGQWVFRFDPDEHDLNQKSLFVGTEFEMTIPEGREGLRGLRDALDVIETMANHPSTREFVCIKLINRFVSDDITLRNYKDGTAPAELVELLDAATAKWEETDGSIKEVIKVILDDESYFWSPQAFLVKAKSPIEFINSSLRAINADVSRRDLPEFNENMGMHLFTRDEPNGWSEYGYDWIDTGALLERIKFVQRAAGNGDDDIQWDVQSFLDSNSLVTAEQIVQYFNRLLFQSKLSAETIEVLLDYANTDNQGNPSPFSPERGNYLSRVESLVGLILSTPDWQYQ